jgi:3-deoxy-D-manno-octulosonic-acid transferase
MAPFSSKIRTMLIGRTISLDRIKKFRKEHSLENLVWFHAASVGEFEQALPVIKLLKDAHPELAVAVSFFSPSGFELRHKHPLVDVSFYLPSDRSANAVSIIRYLKPKALILVKYEFWFNLLRNAKRLGVPVISICCILKKEKFSKWPSSVLMRKNLPLVHYFFVQNVETSRLLQENGIQNFTLSGDTRVDRVLEIKEAQSELPWLEAWKGQHKLLIIGSAWTEDILYLRDFLQHAVVEVHGVWKVLIAPHEIGEGHLQHIRHALKLPFEFYASWKENQNECDILILNTLGMLSKAYRYADAAWIGGAFKTGLHNTLEAAVFGIPVGFGPVYHKFQEAQDLVDMGIAKSFPASGSVWEFFQEKTENQEELNQIQGLGNLYFERQKGASNKIFQYLENILTT